MISPSTIRYSFMLLFIAGIALTFRLFVFGIYEATRDYPEFGILHGDVILTLEAQKVSRGVLILEPTDVMGRVLAVEGDRVETKNGRLWINEVDFGVVGAEIPLKIVNSGEYLVAHGKAFYAWKMENLQSRAIVVLFSISPTEKQLRWDRVLHSLTYNKLTDASKID